MSHSNRYAPPQGPVDDMADGVIASLARITKHLRTRKTMTVRLAHLLRDPDAGLHMVKAVDVALRRRLIRVEPVYTVNGIRLRRRIDPPAREVAA